jgi:hypothetical protein
LTYNSLSEEQVITHKFKCPAWKPAGFTHTQDSSFLVIYSLKTTNQFRIHKIIV